MKKLLKLVIADDEAYIRNSLKNLFPWEEMGYTVDALFSNGAKALDYLYRQEADVVLTDIQMPVLDGLDLARSIWEAKLPTSVVLLSAYSDFEYARKGICYGTLDYITKPVCYEELIDVFTSLYDRITERKNCLLTKPCKPDTISKIVDYIESHVKDVTLEDVAKHVELSPDYVSRLFSKVNGLSFAEFIYKYKMEQASLLIRRLDLQINDVAEHLGYHNAKNFSRAFHNFYNMTPWEYRKQKSTPDNN